MLGTQTWIFSSSSLNVTVDGGELYYITINEETFITDETEIELQLSRGINELIVRTNKDCQGVYKKTIFLNTEPLVYPNPIVNTLFIEVGDFNESSVPIEIYDLAGKLIFSKSYNIRTSTLEVDLSNLTSGFYVLKLRTEEKTHIYKIGKQWKSLSKL